MKQTILKYLMIGVLVISSISCMDKERDLSWERRHMPKRSILRLQHDPSRCFEYQLLFQKRQLSCPFDIYDQDPIEYSA